MSVQTYLTSQFVLRVLSNRFPGILLSINFWIPPRARNVVLYVFFITVCLDGKSGSLWYLSMKTTQKHSGRKHIERLQNTEVLKLCLKNMTHLPRQHFADDQKRSQSKGCLYFHPTPLWPSQSVLIDWRLTFVFQKSKWNKTPWVEIKSLWHIAESLLCDISTQRQLQVLC